MPAPPPYRPFDKPVQRQAAPPVFRPPAPKPLPPAPPVYRPSSMPAQAKPAARNVYRPASAPPVYRPAAAPPVQRYKVLPPAKIYQNAPRWPLTGYPYAITGAAQFNAQAQGANAAPNDFLTGGGGVGAAANVQPANLVGLSLRVSDDNEMAIEDSNLVQRQPKVFYATQGVVTAANQALHNAQSRVRLVPGAQTITIWTSFFRSKTLNEITPARHGGATANSDTLPQNCNSIAAEVTGWDAEAANSRGGGKAAEVAARMAPTARGAYRTAYRLPDHIPFDEAHHMNALAQEYLRNATDWGTWWQGINRYAKPKTGEAYVIGTIGGQNALGQVRDYASGVDRNLNWPYHFAGVVARSGKDRVTLENYARGDNRQNAADPRWYFQMYGEAQGQTFHEQHEATQGYSNPITLAVNRNTDSTPIHRIDG